MQQSLIMPIPFDNHVICALNGQYMSIPGAHYPLFFISYNHLLGYETPSQNIALNNLTHIQNAIQTPLLQFSFPSCGSEPLSPASPTQNGQSQSQPFPQIQKKKQCVKKQIFYIPEKRMKEGQQKRGNDRFIKKNTQSNVVNQIFSFLWTPQKSNKYLVKILPSEEKIETFYALMRTIKTHCKSQLNRFYLKSLIESSEWECGLRKLKKKAKKMGNFSPQELCQIVRKLVYLYLREISLLSIMTSKKMNRQLWSLHIAKCREITSFLFQQTSQ